MQGSLKQLAGAFRACSDTFLGNEDEIEGSTAVGVAAGTNPLSDPSTGVVVDANSTLPGVSSGSTCPGLIASTPTGVVETTRPQRIQQHRFTLQAAHAAAAASPCQDAQLLSADPARSRALFNGRIQGILPS